MQKKKRNGETGKKNVCNCMRMKKEKPNHKVDQKMVEKLF